MAALTIVLATAVVARAVDWLLQPFLPLLIGTVATWALFLLLFSRRM